ncbi:MAG: hypothetical protein AB1758_18485 [Candidatus Eremiobacterota bacterium]
MIEQPDWLLRAFRALGGDLESARAEFQAELEQDPERAGVDLEDLPGGLSDSERRALALLRERVLEAGSLRPGEVSGFLGLGPEECQRVISSLCEVGHLAVSRCRVGLPRRAQIDRLDEIVSIAREAGAERRAFLLEELRQLIATRIPEAASLAPKVVRRHTVNGRERFACAQSWLRRPRFYRVSIGHYRLLTESQLAAFQQLAAVRDPRIFRDDYDVAWLLEQPPPLSPRDQLRLAAVACDAGTGPVRISDLVSWLDQHHPRPSSWASSIFRLVANLTINAPGRKGSAWRTEPLFKLTGHGRYMLLSPEELLRFAELVRAADPAVEQGTYDAEALLGSAKPSIPVHALKGIRLLEAMLDEMEVGLSPFKPREVKNFIDARLGTRPVTWLQVLLGTYSLNTPQRLTAPPSVRRQDPRFARLQEGVYRRLSPEELTRFRELAARQDPRLDRPSWDVADLFRD